MLRLGPFVTTAIFFVTYVILLSLLLLLFFCKTKTDEPKSEKKGISEEGMNFKN